MPSCRACGRTNPDDARFCGTCGTALGGTGAPGPAPPASGGSMTWGWGEGAPGSGQAPGQGHGQTPHGPTTSSPYTVPTPPAPVETPVLPEARPTGVTAVAVWSMAAGPLFALFGLLLIAVLPSLGDPAVQAELEAQAGTAVFEQFTVEELSAVIGGFGVVLVLLGAATAVAGYGLYTRKPWAWKLTMGVTVVWLLVSVTVVLAGGFLMLALAAGLLYYFTRPGVKAWLTRPEEPEDPWARMLQPQR